MRVCARDTKLLGGAPVLKGEFITALVGAANRDPSVFDKPCRFSLSPAGTTEPKRDLDDYLLFGSPHTAKSCWGRNRVAMPILQESLWACSRLTGLRRPAGPDGAPLLMVGVRVGLLGRFSGVTEDPRQAPCPADQAETP